MSLPLFLQLCPSCTSEKGPYNLFFSVANAIPTWIMELSADISFLFMVEKIQLWVILKKIIAWEIKCLPVWCLWAILRKPGCHWVQGLKKSKRTFNLNHQITRQSERKCWKQAMGLRWCSNIIPFSASGTGLYVLGICALRFCLCWLVFQFWWKRYISYLLLPRMDLTSWIECRKCHLGVGKSDHIQCIFTLKNSQESFVPVRSRPTNYSVYPLKQLYHPSTFKMPYFLSSVWG